MSVHRFFFGGGVDLEGLSTYLDRLENHVRISEVQSFTAREQARLFDLAKHFRPLTLEHFVHETASPLHQIIHYGKNSLPVFNVFEKRFCRPDRRTSAGELWGYNEQPLKWLTGPGYFVARETGDGQVVIDYGGVPPGKPSAWPAILPNSAGLGRFVFHQTRDYVRGISRYVSVGRATRRGKAMNNWFVLCRGETGG